jgi:hypothetical protein
LVPLAIVHQVQACLNRDMKLSFVLVALCIALQVVAQTTVVTDAQLKGLTIAKVHKLLGEPLHSRSESTGHKPGVAETIALGGLTNAARLFGGTKVTEVWALSPHDYLTVTFNRGKAKQVSHDDPAPVPNDTPSRGTKILLTPQQITAAILEGRAYKTANEFIDKHLSGRRVKLASVMAADGIKKTAMFFNDWEAVVAASALAHQQMRELRAEEIQPTGMLHALVEVSGAGILPTSKMSRRYSGDQAHLVLKIGDVVVQPVSKDMVRQSESAVWAVLIGIGGGRSVRLSFEFDVSAEMLDRGPVEAILIDGDGHRHQAKANLTGILGEVDTAAK